MKNISEIIENSYFENMEYEYKLILNSEEAKIEKWAKTLVVFSNSIGGYIIVGVNDEGYIVGLTAKELDLIKNLVLITINRYIFPHINVVFDAILVDLKYVLIIKVPYSNQIVVYKTGDYNEKVYIRENGATVVVSVNQILTLGKRKFGVDNQILDKIFSKNNFTMFYSLAAKYRKDGKKLDESILISKELILEDGRITSGLNMFSDDYSNDDTLMVCRLWNGFTKGVDETLDVKEYKGSISKTFEECINFIKRNTRSGFIKMRDGSRLDTESYPELAIREAIVNAIEITQLVELK